MATWNRRRLGLLGAALLAACGTGGKTSSLADEPRNAVGSTQGDSAATVLGSGAVLDVPGQYPTIASALAAAQPGDTVRIEAGTYFECPVLVNGVSLVGPELGQDEMPLVTLDGGGTCNAVISGDATIVDGALVRGIRITNAGVRGVFLSGSRGVTISQSRVRGTPGIAILAGNAEFTLEHSRVSRSGGAGGVVVHGSKATLVANEIFENAARGVVVSGANYLSNPSFAPSQAQLVGNRIHDNGLIGVAVEDKGSIVRGIGNSYVGNALDGVQVLGGGAYRGEKETFTVPAGGFGVYVQGCDLRCVTQGCSTTTILLDRSSVTLNDSSIGGSPDFSFGIHAVCGADLELNRITVAGTGVGAFAGSLAYLSETLSYSLPSTFNATDSAFAGNRYAGVWLNEKDTSGRGSRNRFTGNAVGLQLSAGASYDGKYDSFSSNSPGDGIAVSGCGVICSNPDCSSRQYVQEVGRLTLDGASLEDNAAQGVNAACGADVSLRKSRLSGNACGVVALAHVDLGDGVSFDVPTTIRARETMFASNWSWGAIDYDSFLDLGTDEDPGLNSFLSNGEGSIANVSTNQVLAQWNWFGTANPAAIAATLGGYDIGSILYTPFLTRPPAGRSTR
jgi:Right handed beta helix region